MTLQRFMYDKSILKVDDGYVVRIRYGATSFDIYCPTFSQARVEYNKWIADYGDWHGSDSCIGIHNRRNMPVGAHECQ